MVKAAVMVKPSSKLVPHWLLAEAIFARCLLAVKISAGTYFA
jgi:hypothetical protein